MTTASSLLWGYEGYAYGRFTLELHFPLKLQPSTTIYALAFAEAGNAWTSVKDFSPFNLKRSAGVGVRIYLSIIGFLGIDWAYGFDKVWDRGEEASSTSYSDRNSDGRGFRTATSDAESRADGLMQLFNRLRVKQMTLRCV